ncbi:MAG: glycosylhydrolase-like jelly roll fold domain-containing protein [Verrucomicrobiota bacterium]
MRLKSIHRRDEANDGYFIANLSTNSGSAQATFGLADKQPELWNPVTGERRDLPEFEVREGKTLVPLEFSASESCLVVFRKPVTAHNIRAKDFPTSKTIGELTGAWAVSFDPKWGGPERTSFERLDDWSKRPEPGIRFYSGAAVYTKMFDLPAAGAEKGRLFLDLGVVREIAAVRLNGKDLGVVWTAPWRVDISSAVKPRGNHLEIEVVNVWANRLIGDEQEPADCEWNQGDHGNGGPLKAFPDWFIKGQPRPAPGRYTFTTWNYFTKDSQLVPSGLIGPVRLIVDASN